MAHLTRAALDHLERCHGIASPGALIDRGVSSHAIRVLVARGQLELVMDGAYRLRGTKLTELARCAAVCAAHPGHAIAGPTAARLHGLRRVPRDRTIHIVSPPGARPTRTKWVKPYRTAALHPHDIEHRPDGIAVTARPRTALDMARWVDDVSLLSIVEQAMVDGPHSVDEMRDVALDWVSPRRRWLRRYLEVLDRRLPGGAAQSHLEVIVGDALVRAGVVGLVRQHQVRLPSGRRAFFDLAVPELKWAIEIDGFPTHRESVGRFLDAERDREAAEIEWATTRIPPDDVSDRFDATIANLLAEYRRRRSETTRTRSA